MIEWKRFEDEKPEMRKDIILYRASSHSILISGFRRPFDDDKKYNPDFYEYWDSKSRGWGNARPDFYWAEINFPEIKDKTND